MGLSRTLIVVAFIGIASSAKLVHAVDPRGWSPLESPRAIAPGPAPIAGARAPIDFTPDERQRVQALGPWPPAFTRDPSNRVSGNARAIELGRRLFSDARMSPVGYIGCVTCHQPDRAFIDLRARAHGLADLPRNTPTLANLRLQQWYGWGGASDSLWMASIRPMLDARELDSSPGFVNRVFDRDPALTACYRRVFGKLPHANRSTVVNVGKALAAFEETLVTARTPFDEFRDALLSRDNVAVARYPVAAQRGLKVFVGAGGCIRCHAGPNLSDGRFHRLTPAGDTAINAINAINESADTGRLEGARLLRTSAYNLLGHYNDDPTRRNATPTSRVTADEDLRGAFRTPSLRGVAITGPYLHDGRNERLTDALMHPHDNAALPPIDRHQRADLEAFLRTLTDRYGEQRPWPPAAPIVCR